MPSFQAEYSTVDESDSWLSVGFSSADAMMPCSAAVVSAPEVSPVSRLEWIEDYSGPQEVDVFMPNGGDAKVDTLLAQEGTDYLYVM